MIRTVIYNLFAIIITYVLIIISVSLSQYEILNYQVIKAGLCKNNFIPSGPFITNSWQTIIPKHSYVYSAFIDNRINRSQIKIIVLIETRFQQNFNLKCLIWEYKAGNPVTVSAFIVSTIGTQHK